MEQIDKPEPAGGPSSGLFTPKAVPILRAILLLCGISVAAFFTVDLAEHFLRLPQRPQMPWIESAYYHLAELGYALLAIAWIRKTYPGEYGLAWPQGRSFAVYAVAAGLLLGFFVTLVEYAPQIVDLRPPADNPYPVTPLNVTGWLASGALVAGPSDELLFRGLLVGYLARTMPGDVSYRGFAVSGGAVAVAAILAASQFADFLVKPAGVVFGEFVYVFAMGVVFAYWYEKSKSLLAPALAHGIANAVEYALVFTMVASWR